MMEFEQAKGAYPGLQDLRTNIVKQNLDEGPLDKHAGDNFSGPKPYTITHEGGLNSSSRASDSAGQEGVVKCPTPYSRDSHKDEPPNTASQTSVKRKRSKTPDQHLDVCSDNDSAGIHSPVQKRQKAPENGSIALIKEDQVEADLYGLTETIWQYVFTFLPPATLAKLLRVSRSFKSLLTTSDRDLLDTFQVDPATISPTENVWQQCHRKFAPGLPSPLRGQTELSMWQMIKGTRCQQCGVKKRLQTLSDLQNPWAAGPGRDSVRVMWPFLVRLCGQCLRDQSVMEKEILLSSSYPSFLMDGLPFSFILETNDCISEPFLRANSVPVGLQPIKIFYREQIDRLKSQYDSIKANNPKLLPVWVESLTAARKEKLKDSERWELWEKRGTLARLNNPSNKSRISKLKPAVDSSSPSARMPESSLSDNASRDCQDPVSFNGTKTCGISKIMFQPGVSSLASRPSDINHDPRTLSFDEPKNVTDAQTALSNRRNDIKGRCQTLNPPIEIDVLEQMESFHAAMQINKELDNQQWCVLKDRLEAERTMLETCALRRRKESALTASSVGKSSLATSSEYSNEIDRSADSTYHITESSKQPETMSSTGDESDSTTQEIQNRLSKYARFIIDCRWNGGMSLSRDSCSQLAAEVLTHSRKAFYIDSLKEHDLAHSEAHRLTLENMKWLFETEIKPLTEHHQKEIFLCNGCENTTKTYGFEAVVQHYAAKHTNRLSLGSIIVHWKCDWPEEPPFHPNPMLLKALAITAATSARKAAEGENLSAAQENRAHTSYGIIPSIQDFHGSASSAHYLPRPLPRSSQFLSPSDQQDGVQIRDQHNGLLSRPHSNTLRPETSAVTVSDYNLPITFYGPTNGAMFQGQQSSTEVSFQGPPLSSSSVPTTETFRAHQAEMARYARELWFSTAGIKGLLGAVRVQVIIHHASERFVSRFHVEPGVNMFLFGLNHEAAMRPLRSLNGFSCQACATGRPGSSATTGRNISSTLPHLLNHFMACHAEYDGLDWRRDMIQLPPIQTISELVGAPGIDDAKFTLLASTFPQAFPFPVPTLSEIKQNPTKHQQQVLSGDLGVPRHYHRAKDPDPDTAQKSGYSGIIPLPMDRSDFGAIGEDEYDPRRPVYVGRIIDNYRTLPTDSKHGESLSTKSQSNSKISEAERFLEGIRPHLKFDKQKVGDVPAQGESLYPLSPVVKESRTESKFPPPAPFILPNDCSPIPKSLSPNSRAPMFDSYLKEYHTKNYEGGLSQEYAKGRDIAIYYEPPGGWLPAEAPKSDTVYRYDESCGEVVYGPITDTKTERHLTVQRPTHDVSWTSTKVLPSYEARSSHETPAPSRGHQNAGEIYGVRRTARIMTPASLVSNPRHLIREETTQNLI